MTPGSKRTAENRLGLLRRAGYLRRLEVVRVADHLLRADRQARRLTERQLRHGPGVRHVRGEPAGLAPAARTGC